MKFLADRKLFFRQALTVALLLIPLLVITWFLIVDESARVSDTRAKSAGLLFIHPLEEITSGLSSHQTAAAALALGDASAEAELRKAAAHVDEEFAELPKLAEELGTWFGTQSDLRALQGDWNALRQDSRSLSVEESMKRHDALISRAGDINEKAVHEARIVLSDRLDNYLLTDVAVDEILTAERSIGKLMASLPAVTVTKQVTPEQRIHIANLMSLMKNDVDDLVTTLEHAIQSGDDAHSLRSKTQPAAEGSKRGADALATLINDRVLGGQGVQATMSELQAASAAALEAIDTLHDIVQPALVAHLDSHASSMANGMYMHLGIVIAAALLAIALTYVLTRITVEPLREAIRVFDNVAAGKLDNELDLSRHDEVGEVMTKLRTKTDYC